MLFNSFSFAIFFSVVFCVYWAFRKTVRTQNLLLLLASYVFYGWWDIRFLFLIVLTTVIDYNTALTIGEGKATSSERFKSFALLVASAFFCVAINWSAVAVDRAGLHFSFDIDWANLLPLHGLNWTIFVGALVFTLVWNVVYPMLLRTDAKAQRKLFLIISLIANLAILGFFKYFNFFADSFAVAWSALTGMQADHWTLKVILPVGVSFYTFQEISYVVDVYRRDVKARRSLVTFGTFVAFFPQLAAGPIERGKHMLPQYENQRSLNWTQFKEAIWLIGWGLFKKVVVADNMATVVSAVFKPFDRMDGPMEVPDDGARLLMGVLAFAFQIYGDFSGYTDMARGVARLLGIELMRNFNLPYFAISPSDFWRRWHISLSSWLRDYLYIPLGGNRGGQFATYRNLIVTMVLGGLWHGANWTFVLWGLFHGVILAIYRAIGFKDDAPRPWIARLALGLLMFALTLFGWLLFRAQNVTTVGIFVESIFLHPRWSPEAIEHLKTILLYSWLLAGWQICQWILKDLEPMPRLHWFARLNVWILVLMSLVLFASRGSQEFIYFAF